MLDSFDDRLLLAEVQLGNKEAFNQLFNKYWESTYSAAYKRLKDADQAKDVVQEVFVSIWLRRESVIHNLPAYLNTAVRNQVLKQVIKQERTSPFLDVLNNMPAAHQHADANIRWSEFYTAYEALLVTLPPKRQQIFRLRFHEDLTTTAIAAEMGITRKTVQNQLGKAIEQMRAILLSYSVVLFCCFFNQV